ncbi:uncharacterized protein ATNIH1004_011677 [Aspergillus tanneri]|uniref:Terpenoid synthase n=1 Tax=Aspergillus tanneri TaxID=1220188 RepID=A0A5M9M4A1_9EURO|nr:uncharacterized protein ATNIH1004_011677 [Aspergillus tanneri]KAA8641541.1 hypothetical protein ATNIH1004_011677 [Aspergillus tanneri]
MDEVTERFPIYKLHKTAGKTYRDNLKSITRGEPIEDMSQFNGLCPDELLQSAINAQQIFAKDLMPLKRRLLSPHHLQVCIDTFNRYFDAQYEEGHNFCTEQTQQDVLKTRGVTVGFLITLVLCMPSSQAELYSPEDPCLIQLSLFVAFFNDLIGLYKDIESIEQQNDGSAYLNLVRISTREHRLSEEDAIRRYSHILNYFTYHFEFCIGAYPPLRQNFYHECLK